MTTPLIDLGQAQIVRDGTGAVTVDDPDSPLVVRVRVESGGAPSRITEITVSARHPCARISAAGLARLPLTQIRHVAAVSSTHPNDAPWHAALAPRQAGTRSWDLRHWDEVLDVHDWAIRTGRPGGGYQAVAEMWDVTRNPTAYRWVRHAIAATGRRVDASFPRTPMPRR